MKKISRFSFFPMLLLIFLASCEEIADWHLQPDHDTKIVVEAIITNESKRHAIRLTQSKSLVNAKPEEISDAQVYLETSDRLLEFLPDNAEPGMYTSVSTFKAQKDVVYTLKISWRDEQYEASEVLSIVRESGSLNYTRVDQTIFYRLHDVAPLYHPIEQAMYDVHIDWRHLRPDSVSQIQTYFYTFNTVDGSELFRPDQEAIIFPSSSIITITKFGLGDDYANYLRALMLETQWQGGVFDENSSSLPTNISNGGLGYFAVCSVLQKREQIF